MSYRIVVVLTNSVTRITIKALIIDMNVIKCKQDTFQNILK